MAYDLSNLAPAPGSKTRKRRVGRGEASGLGKTSGKGNKGHKARSGGGKEKGFEGGQTPIHRRLPKRGFTNARFRQEYAIVNVGDLARAAQAGVVDPRLIVAAGVVKDLKDGLKVLGDGDVEGKLTVRAHKFSAAAKSKIEAAGGTAEVLATGRPPDTHRPQRVGGPTGTRGRGGAPVERAQAAPAHADDGRRAGAPPAGGDR